MDHSDRLVKFSRCDLLAICGLFFGALITQLHSVLNNAYSFGSTLFDSGIEQSILWRSGWLLAPARVFASHSYFELHLSPILYIPQIVSYLMSIDRMTYYGLVYGAIWAYYWCWCIGCSERCRRVPRWLS